MARIGKDLTQRMVINQWVSFPDELSILASIPQFNNIKGVPDLQKIRDIPLLAYTYVDHDAGISLKVEGLYFTQDESAPDIDAVSRFLRDSVSLKFRYDVIRMLNLRILGKDGRNHLSLPSSPEWARFYENPELKATRDCIAIDHLRAEGFFDDVSAIIVHSNTSEVHIDTSNTPKSEIVWVRLQGYSIQGRRFRGMLLNQPFHNSGIRKNDVVSLNPIRLENGLVLTVEQPEC